MFLRMARVLIVQTLKPRQYILLQSLILQVVWLKVANTHAHLPRILLNLLQIDKTGPWTLRMLHLLHRRPLNLLGTPNEACSSSIIWVNMLVVIQFITIFAANVVPADRDSLALK